MTPPGDVHSTQPLRLVDQRTMERIFEITDAAGISREAVRVPLAGEGAGRIDRFGDGILEIVVPASGPLAPFLERLAVTLSG